MLATVAREDFVARGYELDSILSHAHESQPTGGMLLFSAPAEGASELLKQAYDQLFSEQGEVIPIYFAFNRSDQSIEKAATRFLQTFLSQVVAFRRCNQSLLDSAPEICEITELALPEDGYWIDRLVEACESDSWLADERSFLRQCFSAPMRARAHGARTFVILDELHQAEFLENGFSLVEELNDIYSRSSVTFLLAGRRRFLTTASHSSKAKLGPVKRLFLNSPDAFDSDLLLESLSRRFSVKTTEQTRDLLAQQFCGRIGLLTKLFEAAEEKNIALDSFKNCEQIYVAELINGRIGRYLDSLVDDFAPDTERQREFIETLYELTEGRSENSTTRYWIKKIKGTEAGLFRLMKGAHWQEFIRLNSSMVERSDEHSVWLDYVESRYRLEIKSQPRALVMGESLAKALIGAPELMTSYYRRSSAIGIRGLLESFNCQPVSKALLDYGAFKEKYKGASGDILAEMTANKEAVFELPQIVYSSNCEALYPAISQLIEEERCSVAFGFEAASYKTENETGWIAAEIDSKLEAGRELAEFWCDRLEMAALMCNFEQFQIWLIAPEGFAPEACELLRERGAYFSSRKQVDLLKQHLKVEADDSGNEHKSGQYEMIVPMGEDTELIAAHAVEELARKHNFSPTAINQIKTALIEACINAAEHGHSPDRKIYQKFGVEDDKLVVTVYNRGVGLPKQTTNGNSDEQDSGRRGWGLKLMRSLMDEVNFERVDDGTKISMVKYLPKTATPSSA